MNNPFAKKIALLAKIVLNDPTLLAWIINLTRPAFGSAYLSAAEGLDALVEDLKELIQYLIYVQGKLEVLSAVLKGIEGGGA